MYTDEILSEIKNRINIVDLVSRYVNLKKVGRNYQGLCPFHSEKTPSFFVNPSLNIYKCFGCGAGGDIFKFLQDIEKITFLEAVEKLAKEAGVELPRNPRAKRQYKKNQEIKEVLHLYSGFYHKILFTKIGKQALAYLTSKRGLTLDFIKKFQLGYAPYDTDIILKFANITNIKKDLLIEAGLLTEELSARFKNRVMFPLLDNTGTVIGFSGRTLSSSPNVPKYLNTPETAVFKKRFSLFGLFWAKKSLAEKNMAIITEGQMDVLSSIKAGVSNIVAPLGTALTETQLIILKRFSQNVAFAFDNDIAGKKALERGVILALKQGLVPYVIKIPREYKDIDELIQAEPSRWLNIAQKPVEFFDYIFNLLKAAQKQHIHYTQLEPQIEKIINIIVYAPEVRAQLLIKELSHILDIEQNILKDKLAKKKHEIEQFNKYEFAKDFETNKSNTARREVKNRLLGRDSVSTMVKNTNDSAEASSRSSSSNNDFLLRRVYNIEEYITLLIIHYPILVLIKGVSTEYQNFIMTPELKAIVKHIVLFMTQHSKDFLPSHNKHVKISNDVILESYNKFISKFNDVYAEYINKKVQDTKYYETFLRLATSEPEIQTFDNNTIKEFVKAWLELQHIWLKIRISQIMEALDQLEEQEGNKERINVSVNGENTNTHISPGIKEVVKNTQILNIEQEHKQEQGDILSSALQDLNTSLNQLEQKQLEKKLEVLTRKLSSIEKIINSI